MLREIDTIGRACGGGKFAQYSPFALRWLSRQRSRRGPRCLKHAGDKSPDLRISGCTAAILSGRITGHDLALALIGRGDAYTAKGNYDQAIADYNRAIMLDPKHAPAYKSLGYAYYAKRDYDRAIADYNRAIMLDPKDASAYEGRAGVYYANGNNDQAIADYNQAITLFPRYVGAYFERGGAYGAKKDYAHAIADYTQTIRLDPKTLPPTTTAAGCARSPAATCRRQSRTAIKRCN